MARHNLHEDTEVASVGVAMKKSISVAEFACAHVASPADTTAMLEPITRKASRTADGGTLKPPAMTYAFDVPTTIRMTDASKAA